jgi:HEAT repeat protein
VPALAKALESESPILRSSSAEALGGIGPSAKPAIPALLAAVNNDHSGMERSVALALKNIDPNGRYYFVGE